MIDLRKIGENGLIIQYEELIAMVGYNVAKSYRGKGISKKLDDSDIKDVLLSYINRSDEDYAVWLKNEYDIEIPDKNALLKSFLTMQPNLLYSYRMFTSADSEKIQSLYIYSEDYSPIAEESIKSYGVNNLKYIHQNIGAFLNVHPNMTFITSSTKSIDECCSVVEAPLCLVICDDFMYTMRHMLESGKESSIKEKRNVFLQYTSVISAGVL